MHCFLKMSVNGQKNEFAVSKAENHDLKSAFKDLLPDQKTDTQT